MTSERQKTANRANALRSTGPKTPEGKAVVRLNALQHGLLAREVVLPGEDADAFEDLWNRVRTSLSPEGPVEEFLVDRVVNGMWRLRRSERAETALLHSRLQGLKADRLEIEVRSYMQVGSYKHHASLTVITDEAAHAAASEALECARDEQHRDEVLLGRAIEADAKEGDSFAKLSRYERTLERSLLRTLDDLHRIQERRRKRTASLISDAITLDSEATE